MRSLKMVNELQEIYRGKRATEKPKVARKVAPKVELADTTRFGRWSKIIKLEKLKSKPDICRYVPKEVVEKFENLDDFKELINTAFAEEYELSTMNLITVKRPNDEELKAKAAKGTEFSVVEYGPVTDQHFIIRKLEDLRKVYTSSAVALSSEKPLLLLETKGIIVVQDFEDEGGVTFAVMPHIITPKEETLKAMMSISPENMKYKDAQIEEHMKLFPEILPPVTKSYHLAQYYSYYQPVSQFEMCLNNLGVFNIETRRTVYVVPIVYAGDESNRVGKQLEGLLERSKPEYTNLTDLTRHLVTKATEIADKYYPNINFKVAELLKIEKDGRNLVVPTKANKSTGKRKLLFDTHPDEKHVRLISTDLITYLSSRYMTRGRKEESFEQLFIPSKEDACMFMGITLNDMADEYGSASQGLTKSGKYAGCNSGYNYIEYLPPENEVEELAYLLSKTVIHECGHGFGIGEHCSTHSCLLNGCADLIEDITTPLVMCPVCFTKLSIVCRDKHFLRNHISGVLECPTILENSSLLERDLGWYRTNDKKIK